MKNKKIIWIILLCILILSLIFIFFNKKTAKVMKIGNNSSSQEIIDNILNISSYEVTIEVEIQSNKNKNKYVLKQQYISPDISTQEVLEPSNIEGVKIIKNKNNLKLENTKLNLATVFENYEYVADNTLDLSCFIQEYISDNNSSYKEENGQILMETQSDNKIKTLYVDRNTGNPIKMEVKDTNKKTQIYILYNEVKINSLKEENILAFRLYNDVKDV